ncbi:MAG: hypothetical protein QXI39_04375 [Candidatus Bathyarchaeia archaeon]
MSGSSRGLCFRIRREPVGLGLMIDYPEEWHPIRLHYGVADGWACLLSTVPTRPHRTGLVGGLGGSVDKEN